MSTLKKNFTIGCDPEVFISNEYTGQFIPASIFNDDVGDKHNPTETEYGIISVDGCALEFGTKPTDTFQLWMNRLEDGMNHISQMARKKDTTYTIDSRCVAEFSKDWWVQVPRQNKRFGCDPDFKVSGEGDLLQNEVRRKTNTPMRTAGGHVHIGWTTDASPYDKQHLIKCANVIRLLETDGLLPSPMNTDLDEMRRHMYGGYGVFRPKSYGLEYRALSNFWVHDKYDCEQIFKAVAWVSEKVGE